jgi:hypothetical protein
MVRFSYNLQVFEPLTHVVTSNFFPFHFQMVKSPQFSHCKDKFISVLRQLSQLTSPYYWCVNGCDSDCDSLHKYLHLSLIQYQYVMQFCGYTYGNTLRISKTHCARLASDVGTKFSYYNKTYHGCKRKMSYYILLGNKHNTGIIIHSPLDQYDGKNM